MDTFENKYNEALEKARQLCAYPTTKPFISDLQDLFPELKESEDERIRKELITHCRNTTCVTVEGVERIVKWITWLEKQESVGEIVERCKTSWYNEGKIQGQIEGLSDEEKYQQGWHDALEKQGEHHIACSEEQMKVLDEVLNFAANHESPYWNDYIFETLNNFIRQLYIAGNNDTLNDKDEEIRKALINVFATHKDYEIFFGVSVENIVAWLEKQGKQRTFDYENANIQQKDFAPKVAPKFKNGQWIVWQNKCYKVNYNGCGYELIDQNGLSTSLEYGTIDENAHLWDITKDAKDGDVLFGNCCGTFICEYYNEYETKSYCRFDGNRFIPQKESGWDATILKPATKEQCDLLFQKMKKAGYEWDAEKKEKKKIESKFNVGDWVVIKTNGNEHVEQIIRIEYFANGHPQYILSNGLWFGNGTEARLWSIADAKDGDVLVEDSCIFIIQKLGDNSTAAKTYCTLYNDGDFDDGSILYFDINSTKPATKEQRDTLMKAMADAGYTFDFKKKELKKIEQKLAWSEEDEKILNTTISFLSEYAAKGYENAVMCMDWLKSLKGRIGG